nr:MAG TPA: hypothetical protein [Caudoviricetes sp.]
MGIVAERRLPGLLESRTSRNASRGTRRHRLRDHAGRRRKTILH